MPNSLPQTREQLYQALWQQPRCALAREWGLTSERLRQVCQRLEIPVPSRGYWTQHALDKAPDVSPLQGDPEAPIDLFHTTCLKQQPSQLSGQAVTPVSHHKQMLPVMRRAWRSYHAAQCARDYRFGFLAPDVAGLPVLKVFPDTLPRALLIMDALVRSFNQLHWTISFDEQNCNFVEIKGQRVPFVLREHLKAIEDTTASTVYPSLRRYVGSGLLKLCIGPPYATEVKDQIRTPLENRLGDALEHCYQYAIQEQQRQRTRQYNAQRIAQRELLRSLVVAAWKLQEVSIDQRQALLSQHQQANELRSFAYAAQRAWKASADTAQQHWLQQLYTEADRLDPLCHTMPADLTEPLSVLDYVHAQINLHPVRYGFLSDWNLDFEIAQFVRLPPRNHSYR